MSLIDDILSVTNPAPRLKEPTDFDEFERPLFLSTDKQLESNASGLAVTASLLDSLLNDSRYAGRRVSKRKLDSESTESSNADPQDLNDHESFDHDTAAIAEDDMDSEGSHSKSIYDSEEEEHEVIQTSEADNIQTLTDPTSQISKRLKTSKSYRFEDGANPSQNSEAQSQSNLPIEPTTSSLSNIAVLGTSIVEKHAEAFAIARQSQLLDALLELRIRFQSAMPLINQLPLPVASVDRLRTSISVSHSEAPADDDAVQVVGEHSAPPVAVSFDDFERLSRPDSSEEFNFATARANAQRKLVGLIKSLTEMQSKLVDCSSSKQPDAPRLEFQPPNIPTISDDSSLDLGQVGATIKKALAANHECLQRFRNTVLEQWHERTRAQTGGAHSTRARASRGVGVPDRASSGAGGFAAFESSRTPVELIERSLQLDRDRLLARTRVNRSGARILGLSLSASSEQMRADPSRASHSQHQTPDEAASETFDDEDFYHQQLRELIHRRTAGVSDPLQITQKWLQFQLQHEQGLRSKPLVDTRASKGRKLRYTVHQKLVNFMAPNESGSWDEERKKALFASLFDKRNSAAAINGVVL